MSGFDFTPTWTTGGRLGALGNGSLNGRWREPIGAPDDGLTVELEIGAYPDLGAGQWRFGVGSGWRFRPPILAPLYLMKLGSIEGLGVAYLEPGGLFSLWAHGSRNGGLVAIGRDEPWVWTKGSKVVMRVGCDDIWPIGAGVPASENR